MGTIDGYLYNRDSLLKLFVGMQFPERTPRESALIVDFLNQHVHEYDRYAFTVRVGHGTPPNPDHLPGVQQQALRNSKMRIDMMAWSGSQPFIFEVKERAIHAAIGQCLTYAQLYAEDNPDEPYPILGVIARTIEPDMERVFQANGITVYLYAPPVSGGGAARGGAATVDGAPA